MPDKRQTSKQRRTARNRARRQALSARRENAATLSYRAASAATGSTGSGRRGAATGSSRSSSGIAYRLGLRGAARPGDRAMLLALGFAVASFLALLFLKVPTDDRGEVLPALFSGVALSVRSKLTGHEVTSESTGVISAYGAQILLPLAVPVVIVAVTFYFNRRSERRTRVLTIGLVALALLMIFTSVRLYQLFLPSLIAVGVASFQVRRAEMPARTAERAGAARPGREDRRGDVIDVDEAEPDDDEYDEDYEDVDEEGYEDEGYEGEDYEDVEDEDDEEEPDGTAAPSSQDAGGADIDETDAEHDDVLAELEAELARESESESEEDEPDDPDAGERRR